MTPLAQRVANAIYHNGPRVLCFACLAARQGLQEHDVRAVAVVLVARAGLDLGRRVCWSCGREDDVLVAEKAA